MEHIFVFTHFSCQTPAPTRTASFSESWTANDVTPPKKCRAGLPGGNSQDPPLHSFLLAWLHMFSYYFLFYFSHPCTLYTPLPPLYGHCFLPTFLFIHLPVLLFLDTFMLHICLSKTVSILYCGLWRIWSQAAGKVSVRCALTQAWFGNFLFFWFASFLLTLTLKRWISVKHL